MWWEPEKHSARRPRLLARGRLMAQIRAYFEDEDFIETACGQLQISPGNETHLHGFGSDLLGLGGERRRLYLATSPEFAMKKLLAAGERKIFEFARVFRNREAGTLHAPEFTMLEWYRAGETYEDVLTDALTIVMNAGVEVRGILQHRGQELQPDQIERLTVASAFDRYAGVDLAATIAHSGVLDREALAHAALGAGVRVAEDDTWADIFSRVLAERVDPHLGKTAVTVLESYPACQAALACPNPADSRFAQRFEIFACGIELANGFAELTDVGLQRTRLTAEMDEKERRYGTRYPLDEDFLAALAYMPPAAGCALGFDRLAMLATDAEAIDDVMWTPPWRIDG